MNTLTNYALQTKYEQVKKLRPKLEEIKNLLNWKRFLSLFPDKESCLGRPEYNRILMLKIMFLQSWYSISDEEIEFQVYDRLSFQQFLDFPEEIPDYTTIWRFRESLTEGTIAEQIWEELQHQILSKGVEIKEGKIQDATFIIAEPGKKNSGLNGRGREAKASRNRDATWTKKGNKNYFGYKLHSKVDVNTKIITEFGVSTAKTFDGHIDLADSNEITYRDRCYSGSKTKAKGDATMKRGNLTPHQKLRNKRISRTRCRGEHPYAAIHRVFHGGKTKLTTLARVYVQQLFVCASYNLLRLTFLLRDSVSSLKN